MADVTIMQINGVDYNVKDSTARNNANSALQVANEAGSVANNAKNVADSAQEKANVNATDIANLEGKTLSVSYSNEKITFSKGV